MSMQWNKVLEVGHPEIDAQHQELVKRINVLLDAMTLGKGREEVNPLLNFLAEYVISHFTMEEKLMGKFAYPKAKEHKALHIAFIKDFQLMEEDYAKNGPTLNLILKLQKRVVEWLIQHISHVDKELGDFLKTRGY